ncbi:hypothetical protein HL658_33870 [Azospirillum sp. RWY-5-1]|uniref:Ribbon-helix-helix protein CopG domain-containing protein n=1 Tax=Azospirillum oleiclasticum TaxID=2735135 RepID=A0ABX2TJY1_9PROT|nr:type II toxin-antitoxin system VapB family antitoxin [Azospirillum oleiclasticum]NYZ17558.1 hypothetical protein [Azospirillum oleiclasticum]NYZ24660.1 hypothetical protein [Azospirillum oleiclasticum]
MTLRIADPGLVAKIDRLARMTGLGPAQAVETAVDQMLAGRESEAGDDAVWEQATAILAELDRIPDRPGTAPASADAWLTENQEALESSNAYVEARGMPLANSRRF